MKLRVIVLVLAVLVASGSVWALDFGGTLDNSTGYIGNSTPPFQQSDTLTFWFNTQLGKSLTFNSQLHGALGNVAPVALADLDSLNLVGLFPNVAKGPTLFSFTLGRFNLTDTTGDIYNQSIDGFQFGFTYPHMSLSTTLGYTGLTINPTSTIVMTKADSIAQGDPTQFFGSPRVVGLLGLSFPSLFARQDLNLQAIFQEDLRPLFETLVAAGTTTPSSSLGGTLNNQYFTGALSGPLIPSLYYDASFTLETGKALSYITDATTGLSSYQYESILAYYATGGFRYYLPQLLNSVAGIGASYASGDADYVSLLEGNTSGNATAFQPITRGTVATVFSPVLKNIVVGSVSYSIKPLSMSKNRAINNLQTEVKVLPFLRPTLGPVGATGVDPSTTNTNYYLGTEFDGSVNYRPFSDLGVSLQAGLFLPNATAFVSSLAQPQFGGKLEFSFSF